MPKLPDWYDDYKDLTSAHERARFLLDIGVEAPIAYVDGELCYQARVDGIHLPVTAKEQHVALKRGIEWLEAKMDPQPH